MTWEVQYHAPGGWEVKSALVTRGCRASGEPPAPLSISSTVHREMTRLTVTDGAQGLRSFYEVEFLWLNFRNHAALGGRWFLQQRPSVDPSSHLISRGPTRKRTGPSKKRGCCQQPASQSKAAPALPWGSSLRCRFQSGRQRLKVNLPHTHIPLVLLLWRTLPDAKAVLLPSCPKVVNLK